MRQMGHTRRHHAPLLEFFQHHRVDRELLPPLLVHLVPKIGQLHIDLLDPFDINRALVVPFSAFAERSEVVQHPFCRKIEISLEPFLDVLGVSWLVYIASAGGFRRSPAAGEVDWVGFIVGGVYHGFLVFVKKDIWVRYLGRDFVSVRPGAHA